MDAALIEAEILESGLIDSDHQSHHSRASKSLSPQTRLQHTEHYVQDQSSLKSNSHNPHASSYQELTLATNDIKQPIAPILYTPLPMKTEAPWQNDRGMDGRGADPSTILMATRVERSTKATLTPPPPTTSPGISHGVSW